MHALVVQMFSDGLVTSSVTILVTSIVLSFCDPKTAPSVITIITSTTQKAPIP